MTEVILFSILIGLIIAGILAAPQLQRSWRDRRKRQPFPALWAALVEDFLPFYQRLLPDERRQFQGHLQVFLAEKQFIGCGGLQITEEMRVGIGAIACLLLLNGHGNPFPRLRSILVYPSAYVVTETEVKHPFWVEEKRVVRLGESWVQDQVVLAWDQVAYDRQHWQDGHNLVLHEFAHQLDQADGIAEGVPILPTAADYQTWAAVMGAAYQRLCWQVQQGQSGGMDDYGATNPAEFFAVATETFFEQPHALRQHHRDLYDLFQRYYRLDPARWQEHQ